MVELKQWMECSVKSAMMLILNRWLHCLTQSNNFTWYKVVNIHRKMYVASVDTLLFVASLLTDFHVPCLCDGCFSSSAFSCIKKPGYEHCEDRAYPIFFIISVSSWSGALSDWWQICTKFGSKCKLFQRKSFSQSKPLLAGEEGSDIFT